MWNVLLICDELESQKTWQRFLSQRGYKTTIISTRDSWFHLGEIPSLVILSMEKQPLTTTMQALHRVQTAYPSLMILLALEDAERYWIDPGPGVCVIDRHSVQKPELGKLVDYLACKNLECAERNDLAQEA